MTSTTPTPNPNLNPPSNAPRDHWSSSTYQSSAAYVPRLTSKVYALLNPQPGERILDIGCGDGVLTARIAEDVACKPNPNSNEDPSSGSGSSDGNGFVLGLDASASMISHAQATYQKTGSRGNLAFERLDCAALPAAFLAQHAGSFDKIFSNAALHWILASTSTSIEPSPSTSTQSAQQQSRISILHSYLTLLKPSGVIVFEMGGAGNVAEVHAALIYALVARGVPVQKARAASPWFFPSAGGMRGLLRGAGFEVADGGPTVGGPVIGAGGGGDMQLGVELEYRPTRLEPRTAAAKEGGKDGGGGTGGLEGWVRLMGAPFLDLLSEGQQREDAVKEVCEVLGDVCARPGEGLDGDDDGGEWLGYVRCRGVARRPPV